ncbi:hypothetical protein J0J18_24365, partial [Vibrio vulnificus]|nr:hypothetical protein [Vibrio vulnificus]
MNCKLQDSALNNLPRCYTVSLVSKQCSFMKGGSGFSPTKESLIFRLVARCITFETRPGTRKARAVALRSASDLSVLYKCESLS